MLDRIYLLIVHSILLTSENRQLSTQEIRDHIYALTSEFLRDLLPHVDVDAIDAQSRTIRDMCTDARVLSLRNNPDHEESAYTMYIIWISLGEFFQSHTPSPPPPSSTPPPLPYTTPPPRTSITPATPPSSTPSSSIPSLLPNMPFLQPQPASTFSFTDSSH